MKRSICKRPRKFWRVVWSWRENATAICSAERGDSLNRKPLLELRITNLECSPLELLLFAQSRFRIGLESLFLHFAQDILHVVHFVPYFLAHVDGRFLLGGDRDAIAWPRIQLDDFFLLQFVFRPDDGARIIRCVLQIVNNDPLDFGAQSRHQMPDEIVGKRTLLGNLAHEHRDRAANGLIDINNEYLVVVSQKHRATATGWQNRAHLHFDHRFIHRANGTRPIAKNKRWGWWIARSVARC